MYGVPKRTKLDDIVHTLPKTFVSPCTKLVKDTFAMVKTTHLSCANVQNCYAQPTHQLRMESISKIRNYVITRCGCDLNKAHPAESETQSSCRTKKPRSSEAIIMCYWDGRGVCVSLLNR